MDAAIKTLDNNLKARVNQEEIITFALNLDASSHVKLNHPLRERTRLISYSRSKNAEYSILEIFSAFTSYMKDITSEMFDSEPMKIVGKVSSDNSTITFAEIVKLGTMENIAGKMVDEIF